jgi:hypothetical protein
MKAISPEQKLFQRMIEIKAEFTRQIDQALMEYAAAKPQKKSEPGRMSIRHPINGKTENIKKKKGGRK